MANSFSLEKGFNALKYELDRLVVGHEALKKALLLSLIVREHIYAEGPPGTAKTLLAEAAALASGLKFFYHQLHRDSRLHELLGVMQIRRELGINGEAVHAEIRPGGFLSAQVVVLDDISRAPGEALNILMRLLNERKFRNLTLPLYTAMATSNPAADRYYTESLDPAHRDRFLFQIRGEGLLARGLFPAAGEVLKLHQNRLESKAPESVLTPDFFSTAYRALEQVRVPRGLREELLNLLMRMTAKLKGRQQEASWSDRTFLVKIWKAIRGHALLRGGAEAERRDLEVLNLITAFRLPEELQEDWAEAIAAFGPAPTVLSEEREIERPPASGDSPVSETQEEQSAPDRSSVRDKDEARPEGSRPYFIYQTSPPRIKLAVDYCPEDNQPYTGEPPSNPLDLIKEVKVKGRGEEAVRNLEGLLELLAGRIQKRVSAVREDPGGLPRHYRPLRDLDEISAMHPGDLELWLHSPQPYFPRVLKPERPGEGGHIAILRDVSASMTGEKSAWSLALVQGLMTLAKRRKMMVGYLEFNHQTFAHRHAGRFFTRDFKSIEDYISGECFGMTNYETALTEALSEFPRPGRGNKHLLFITDGLPSSGDLLIVTPRQLASRLGVKVHSIFIGSAEVPEILKVLTADTSGSLFYVARAAQGALSLKRREKLFSV